MSSMSKSELELKIEILELKLELLDIQLRSSKCPHCNKTIKLSEFVGAAAKYAKEGGTGGGLPGE